MSEIAMLFGLVPPHPVVGGRHVTTAQEDEVGEGFVKPARGVFQQASGDWCFRVSHAGKKYRVPGFNSQMEAVKARDAF